MFRIDALLPLAIGANLFVAFTLAMAIFEGKAHGTRASRLLALSLRVCESNIGQVKVEVYSPNDKVVAVIQRNDLALVSEFILVV
jgi:hypothetical protein